MIRFRVLLVVSALTLVASTSAATPDPAEGARLLERHRQALASPAERARGALPDRGLRLAVVAPAVAASGAELLAAHPAAASAPQLGRIQPAAGKARGGSGAGARIYRDNVSRVALIATRSGATGSGLVISDDGRILSNLHVVEGQAQVMVFFRKPGGEDLAEEDALVGRVIAHAPDRDLALVQVDELPPGTTPVSLGKLDSVDVGSDVYAIGHPYGLLWSFTEGVISQIRRDFEWSGGTAHRFRATVIQTQTPINPGNSGGPLFNEGGEVVGVNSFIDRRAEGLNFAVAVNEIEGFLEDPQPAPAVAAGPRRLGAPDPRDARDLDGDGRPDAYGYDRDGDARGDVWLYDLDGDGAADALGLDLNGNGRPDTLAHDLDGDGIPDLYRQDANEDGVFDLEGIDLNGDGRIDRIRPL